MIDLEGRRTWWRGLISPFVHAILGLFLATLPARAELAFYVNPSVEGPGTGSANRPWAWPNWGKVDRALATEDVTVYFACDQRSETTLEILRLDQSKHRLTVDGMSRRQEHSGWVDCLAELPRTGQGGFTIEAGYALRTGNNKPPFVSRINWTVKGFTLRARAKIVEISNTLNAILEFCDLAHLEDAREGPGLHVDNRNASGGTGLWSRNLTIRYNVVHDTLGEGIYVNGNKSGSNKGQPSSRSVTIEYNEVYGSGRYGGQGDGIDIKDGVRSLVVRGNTVHDNAVIGIITDSGGVFEGNLIYQNGHGGINLTTVEALYQNRDGTKVINNITVGNNGAGIVVRGPGNEPDNWTNLLIANNTVAFNSTEGVSIDPNAQVEPTIRLINNILYGNQHRQLEVGKAEQLAAHSHNLYGSGRGLVRIADISYSESTLDTFEQTAVAGDPGFANGGEPDQAENFALAGPSPALGSGLQLSDFNRDYFGAHRGENWDMGAIAAPPPTAEE